MSAWELSDEEQEVVGPVDEAQVVAMIADGLPSTVLVRQVGETEWRGLRSHIAFALALEEAAGAAAAGPHPPRPTSLRWAALVIGLVIVAWAAFLIWRELQPEIVTARDMPPAPAPAPALPSPLQPILAKTTAAEAFAEAAPRMTDAFNTTSEGTRLFTLWSLKNLRWADVGVAADETSYGKVQKDVEAERGKRLCVSGTVIEIASSKEPLGTLAVGLLMSAGGMSFYHFYGVRSSGDIVEQNSARFCGFVAGVYNYANSGGGIGHAVELVGLFDIAPNKGIEGMPQPAAKAANHRGAAPAAAPAPSCTTSSYTTDDGRKLTKTVCR